MCVRGGGGGVDKCLDRLNALQPAEKHFLLEFSS